ncbi:MAG: hypothetical protein ACOYJY_05300 [Acutalibacteraceae bacterium]|jgi:hypothetical protein
MKKRYDPPWGKWQTIAFDDVLTTSGMGTGDAGLDNDDDPGEDWGTP